MTAVDLAQVLKQIAELKPEPFNFPADFQEKIAACPECQGWAKNHPVQGGICNTHRAPLWERDAHDIYELRAIGPRCQMLAQKALDRYQRENKPTT